MAKRNWKSFRSEMNGKFCCLDSETFWKNGTDLCEAIWNIKDQLRNEFVKNGIIEKYGKIPAEMGFAVDGIYYGLKHISITTLD